MTDGPKFFPAWETFVDRLELILRDGGPEAVERPQNQYVLANLNLTVAKLLRDVGQPEAAAHFHTQGEALQDVADGVSHPLFHVPAKPGRQPDTSQTWCCRSLLCIGIEFLMAGGLSQEEAVAFVLRKHRKQLIKLLRPGVHLESSLPTWLKTFATDSISNDVALFGYKRGMKWLAEFRARQPQSAVRAYGEKLVADAAADAAKLIKI
jgi:hypothetical protein